MGGKPATVSRRVHPRPVQRRNRPSHRGSQSGEITPKSLRVLRLSPGVVALLQAHRKAQAAERLRAANVWHESGFVFTTESGQPVDPRNLLRALKVAADRAGLGNVGVHTLRHSAASALLEKGIGLKTVSEMLGHSSVAITGDVYQHVSDGAAQAAADALAAIGV